MATLMMNSLGSTQDVSTHTEADSVLPQHAADSALPRIALMWAMIALLSIVGGLAFAPIALVAPLSGIAFVATTIVIAARQTPARA